MKNILKYSIVIIAMFFSVICFAEDSLTKTLVIEVENATANGDSVAGDEIFIDIYHHNTLSETLEGKIAGDNKVIFEKISFDDHSTAVARVKHQGMVFAGQPVRLIVGDTKTYANVRVFDVSDDHSKISISTHHFIIKLQADNLSITEYMQIKNSSDTAIASDPNSKTDCKRRSKSVPPGGRLKSVPL